MAIDKNARIDIGENTGATATTTIASAATADVQRPSYIQTWPLTTADLTDGAPAGPTTEQQAGVEGEPEIVIPAVVKQWPVWMQRQWRQTQERRLWETTHKPRLVTRIFTPLGTLALCGMLIVALLGFGIGASVHASGSSGGSAGGSQTASGSSGGMSGMGSGSSSSASTANVPDATQQYGNQPAKFVIDPDGVKHFTMTAQQVMWQPVKGQKVLAWTLDGTVPGPVIHVTAGDHIRITIINHLPEPTTIHCHGLEVPTDNDGVPPIGMKPIQPGQSYTYDFTLNDQDAGTHWYHSHFDDLKQVGGGMYEIGRSHV